MTTLDCGMEVRSDEESDAGSLVDFICNDSDESEADAEDTPVQLLDSFVVQGGLRRSTRRSVQTQRYMDEHFVELMTEDTTMEEVLACLSTDEGDTSDEDERKTSADDSDADSEYEPADEHESKTTDADSDTDSEYEPGDSDADSEYEPDDSDVDSDVE